jgi:hypothetical protein
MSGDGGGQTFGLTPVALGHHAHGEDRGPGELGGLIGGQRMQSIGGDLSVLHDPQGVLQTGHASDDTAGPTVVDLRDELEGVPESLAADAETVEIGRISAATRVTRRRRGRTVTGQDKSGHDKGGRCLSRSGLRAGLLSGRGSQQGGELGDQVGVARRIEAGEKIFPGGVTFALEEEGEVGQRPAVFFGQFVAPAVQTLELHVEIPDTAELGGQPLQFVTQLTGMAG